MIGIFQKLVQTDILIFSLLILIFILIYSSKTSSEDNYASRLFRVVIIALIVRTGLAVITWFLNGAGSEYRTLLYWMLAFSYSVTAVPTITWMCYIDYNIFNDRLAMLRRTWLYLIPTYISIILMIVNHFNRGVIFSLTPLSLYVRGPLFFIVVYMVYLMIIAALVFFIRHKSLFIGKITQVLIIFITIALIASVFQTFNFGLSLQWAGNTLVVLITYILIEQANSHKDSLTGLYTRGQFNQRLYFEMRSGEPFSLLMIDLNGFKYINDNFGHNEGDKVLKIVAGVLSSDTSPKDLVCRYGGDEFILIIESDEPEICKTIIDRFDHSLDAYNKKIEGYEISMSYGYKFIDNPGNFNAEKFLAEIDSLMYEDKRKKKAEI